MKTNFIVGMLLLNFSLFAQEVKPITIDMNGEENIPTIDSEQTRSLNQGDYFQIVIDNLNTYLYKVTIEDEDITMQPAELPNSITGLVTPGILDGILTNIRSALSSPVPDVKFLDTLQIEKGNTSDTIVEIKEYAVNSNRYKNLRTALDKPGISDKDKISYTDSILSYHQWIYRYESDALEDKISKLESYYQDILNYETALHYVRPNVVIEDFNNQKVRDLLTEYRNLNNSIQKSINSIENSTLVYDEFKTNNKELINNNDDLKKTRNIVDEFKTDLDMVIKTIKKEITTEKYQELQKGLAMIVNHKDFSFASLPIQILEDGKKIDLTISPRDDATTLTSYETSFRIPDKTKNYWAVTTGLYLIDNLNQNYSIMTDIIELEPDTPTEETEGETEESEGQEEEPTEETIYSFVEEDRSKDEIGVKAMVQYGWYLTETFLGDFYVNLGIGAGLSITEKPKPRFFFGPGVSFGDKNKFTIDFGGAYIFYDKLSNGYNTTDEYRSKPTDYLVTQSQIKGYIGVGYTINFNEGDKEE
ncbi:hypothetical protein RM553_02175 [Zunongwangia sp. F363]|uniref:Outer membrane protein beta-barrel domain-containing protein n=1 Tax=Autumnicola tepida TaxID=3075595 RepID=A0ABU3C5L7_9FLAO|nr:hypothetical protein [Zunongwangia sp. F363]MDT0641628.1 hypothetical protein [Zunongwangia sp. F363]